jgi:hypothetical protein
MVRAEDERTVKHGTLMRSQVCTDKAKVCVVEGEGNKHTTFVAHHVGYSCRLCLSFDVAVIGGNESDR